ncbi:hypothetical protein PRNP1_009332 [Phytophthora ramorum]
MYTNATGAPPVSDKSDACVTPMLLVGCFQTLSPCDANAAGMPHATTTQNQRSVDRLLHPEYADRLRRRSQYKAAKVTSGESVEVLPLGEAGEVAAFASLEIAAK